MNFLIVYAGRHGSTQQIAAAIGQELREAGHTVQVRSAGAAGNAEPYDVAIIGSAIYMGRWLAEARRFVEMNRVQLSTVPVWLFSSGPLGQEDPQPRGDFAHLEALRQATRARGHRTFVGKLDRNELGFAERLVASVVKAPQGDFRDWEAIRRWTREIEAAVQVPAPSGA